MNLFKSPRPHTDPLNSTSIWRFWFWYHSQKSTLFHREHLFHRLNLEKAPLELRSPTSLAPGTSFVEDDFSQTVRVCVWQSGREFRMSQSHYIYCAAYFYYYYITSTLNHLKSTGIRSWRLGTPAVEGNILAILDIWL